MLIHPRCADRVNVFGFFGLPEQVAAGATNWGLQDQQAGLRWVQANAAAMGGEPNRVMSAWPSCSSLPGRRGFSS